MTEFYAHSENDHKEKHSLSKHLHRTEELMGSFACKEDYKSIFKLTGLVHDLGKYQPEFQHYLINGGERGSVPHASWGAGYARRSCRAIEPSIAIDGHHKGLPDNATWKSDTEPFNRGEVEGFENSIKAFLIDARVNEAEITNLESLRFADKSRREVFTRYLFSALTDSDWLSTEEHFDKNIFRIRGGLLLAVDDMLEKLEEELNKKPKEGEINRLRNDARNQVMKKANMPCGFYSLALPTGMGKTLTSMAWALQHAKTNNLKRIIIVLPYINIIDQTSQVLKEIFGEGWVLEHHSGFNEYVYGQKETDVSVVQQRKKLACENWDYPIIVTTTVQFFESLFSNRPSKCRKNHNIAESVVIFDEVQTLPKEVILPTLQMLEDVHDVMNTSFLFCTATQPAFEERQGFDGISVIHPLIDDPAELYEKTKRVEYHLLNELNPIDYRELLNAVIKSGRSSLVIFNTKKSALEFFGCARDKCNWGARYHLSTSMCPSHRKDVINRIRDDLKEKRNILVVSTQLIEAGVDFDFPSVFRAIAPLESVIQSAGRCNRENKLPRYGDVFLFKIQDGGMPDKTYSACAGLTEDLVISDILQLERHDIFAHYYENVVNLYVEPDKYGICKAREEFKFDTVNDAYYIIRDATEGLYIYNFNKESRQLIDSLKHKEFLSKDDYRRMQAFTVQVYQNFMEKNKKMCPLTPHGFRVWYGNYDSQTGISVAPLEADKLVV